VKFNQIYFDAVWADLNEATTYPSRRPTLAHYTSIATLERIVRSGELWLAHPMLMNDHQEMRWGMVEGQKRLLASEEIASACASADKHQLLLAAFNKHYDQFATADAFDVYVGCFCEHDPSDHDGLLSMWRGYGANGGGAAIVFDTSKLIHDDESPLVLAPVVYGTDQQRLNWIETKISELARLIKTHNPPKLELDRAAWHFFNRLKYFALFSKHCGFREEREWRVVYMQDRDPKREYHSRFTYLTNEAGIEPRMKLQVGSDLKGAEPITLSSLVTRILLGPRAGALLSLMATRRMMEQLGEPQLAARVLSSSTPFRG
jgi:hypothetical protein